MVKKIFLLILLTFISKSFSQNDYVTIHVYRPKMMLGSAITHKVNINGREICELDNGGHLEYKSFLFTSFHLTTDGKVNDLLRKDGVKFKGDKGSVHYFIITPKFGGMNIEQIDKPISENELKLKYFHSINDVGIDSNNISNDYPSTNWNKETLILHWKEKKIDNIEGVYEVMDGTTQYELAVINEDNKYSIIYISGANGTQWKVGDIKASMQKTASSKIFKSKWYMLNKNQSKDLFVTFKDDSFLVDSETTGNKDLYIKTFPTYEDGISKK